MMQTIRQWISRAIALCVIGPIAANIASGPVGSDGSSQHTLLTVDSMSAGIVALLVVSGLIVLMGVVGAKLGGRREGLLCMGFVLGWVAWTQGRMGQVYLLSPDAGTSVKLAIESLGLMLVVLFAGVLISRDSEKDPVSSFAPAHLRSWIRNKAMLGALGGGVVGAVAMAWLFGRTDLPGQSVGVGLFGGILAGVVGAMSAASLNGKAEHTGTPFAPIIFGVMLAGVLGPLVGIVAPGLGEIGELAIVGELPGYLALSPAAWVMGALIGVPVGHSWVEHSHARVEHKPAGAR